MGFLLSGLFGAIIATFIAVFYNYISIQVQRRSELTMEVITWLEELYSRLQMMQVQKERVYAGKEPALTQDEYNFMSREVRTSILSSKIQMMTALIYGEGEEVQRINALQGELAKVAELLWSATKNTWPASQKTILSIFKNTIDPLRADTHNKSLIATSIISVMKDTRRRIFQTIIGKSKTVEKIIAREFLVFVVWIIWYLFLAITRYISTGRFDFPFAILLEDTTGSRWRYGTATYPFSWEIFISNAIVLFSPFFVHWAIRVVILFVKSTIWAIKTLWVGRRRI